MLDKHTLRANALAAMRAAIACDWAAVIMNVELQKQEVGTLSRSEYGVSCQLLNLQVEDELSKCHEALTAYYTTEKRKEPDFVTSQDMIDDDLYKP